MDPHCSGLEAHGTAGDTADNVGLSDMITDLLSQMGSVVAAHDTCEDAIHTDEIKDVEPSKDAISSGVCGDTAPTAEGSSKGSDVVSDDVCNDIGLTDEGSDMGSDVAPGEGAKDVASNADIAISEGCNDVPAGDDGNSVASKDDLAGDDNIYDTSSDGSNRVQHNNVNHNEIFPLSDNAASTDGNNEVSHNDGNGDISLSDDVSLSDGDHISFSDGSGDVSLSDDRNISLSNGNDDVSHSDVNNISLSDGSSDVSLTDDNNNVSLSAGSGDVSLTAGNNDVLLSDGNNDVSLNDGDVAIIDGSNDVLFSDGSNGVSLSDGNGDISLSDGSNDVLLSNGSNGVSLSDGSGGVSLSNGSNDVSLSDGNNDVSLSHGSNVTVSDNSGDVLLSDVSDNVSSRLSNHNVSASVGSDNVSASAGSDNVSLSDCSDDVLSCDNVTPTEGSINDIFCPSIGSDGVPISGNVVSSTVSYGCDNDASRTDNDASRTDNMTFDDGSNAVESKDDSGDVAYREDNDGGNVSPSGNNNSDQVSTRNGSGDVSPSDGVSDGVAFNDTRPCNDDSAGVEAYNAREDAVSKQDNNDLIINGSIDVTSPHDNGDGEASDDEDDAAHTDNIDALESSDMFNNVSSDVVTTNISSSDLSNDILPHDQINDFTLSGDARSIATEGNSVDTRKSDTNACTVIALTFGKASPEITDKQEDAGITISEDDPGTASRDLDQEVAQTDVITDVTTSDTGTLLPTFVPNEADAETATSEAVTLSATSDPDEEDLPESVISTENLTKDVKQVSTTPTFTISFPNTHTGYAKMVWPPMGVKNESVFDKIHCHDKPVAKGDEVLFQMHSYPSSPDNSENEGNVHAGTGTVNGESYQPSLNDTDKRQLEVDEKRNTLQCEMGSDPLDLDDGSELESTHILNQMVAAESPVILKHGDVDAATLNKEATPVKSCLQISSETERNASMSVSFATPLSSYHEYALSQTTQSTQDIEEVLVAHAQELSLYEDEDAASEHSSVHGNIDTSDIYINPSRQSIENLISAEINMEGVDNKIQVYEDGKEPESICPKSDTPITDLSINIKDTGDIGAPGVDVDTGVTVETNHFISDRSGVLKENIKIINCEGAKLSPVASDLDYCEDRESDGANCVAGCGVTVLGTDSWEQDVSVTEGSDKSSHGIPPADGGAASLPCHHLRLEEGAGARHMVTEPVIQVDKCRISRDTCEGTNVCRYSGDTDRTVKYNNDVDGVDPKKNDNSRNCSRDMSSVEAAFHKMVTPRDKYSSASVLDNAQQNFDLAVPEIMTTPPQNKLELPQLNDTQIKHNKDICEDVKSCFLSLEKEMSLSAPGKVELFGPICNITESTNTPYLKPDLIDTKQFHDSQSSVIEDSANLYSFEGTSLLVPLEAPASLTQVQTSVEENPLVHTAGIVVKSTERVIHSDELEVKATVEKQSMLQPGGFEAQSDVVEVKSATEQSGVQSVEVDVHSAGVEVRSDVVQSVVEEQPAVQAVQLEEQSDATEIKAAVEQSEVQPGKVEVQPVKADVRSAETDVQSVVGDSKLTIEENFVTEESTVTVVVSSVTKEKLEQQSSSTLEADSTITEILEQATERASAVSDVPPTINDFPSEVLLASSVKADLFEMLEKSLIVEEILSNTKIEPKCSEVPEDMSPVAGSRSTITMVSDSNLSDAASIERENSPQLLTEPSLPGASPQTHEGNSQVNEAPAFQSAKEVYLSSQESQSQCSQDVQSNIDEPSAYRTYSKIPDSEISYSPKSDCSQSLLHSQEGNSHNDECSPTNLTGSGGFIPSPNLNEMASVECDREESIPISRPLQSRECHVAVGNKRIYDEANLHTATEPNTKKYRDDFWPKHEETQEDPRASILSPKTAGKNPLQENDPVDDQMVPGQRGTEMQLDICPMYSCDADMYDDGGKPLCMDVTEYKGSQEQIKQSSQDLHDTGPTEAEIAARHRTPSLERPLSSFKWNYPARIEHIPVLSDYPEELTSLPPLKTCSKPRRLGLSRRQKVKTLHPYSRPPAQQ